jgi:hypothetical protein
MAESSVTNLLCLALTVFVVMPVQATLLEASLSDLMRRLPHALWGLDGRLLALAHLGEQHQPPPRHNRKR